MEAKLGRGCSLSGVFADWTDLTFRFWFAISAHLIPSMILSACLKIRHCALGTSLKASR